MYWHSLLFALITSPVACPPQAWFWTNHIESKILQQWVSDGLELPRCEYVYVQVWVFDSMLCLTFSRSSHSSFTHFIHRSFSRGALSRCPKSTVISAEDVMILRLSKFMRDPDSVLKSRRSNPLPLSDRMVKLASLEHLLTSFRTLHPYVIAKQVHQCSQKLQRLYIRCVTRCVTTSSLFQWHLKLENRSWIAQQILLLMQLARASIHCDNLQLERGLPKLAHARQSAFSGQYLFKGASPTSYSANSSTVLIVLWHLRMKGPRLEASEAKT